MRLINEDFQVHETLNPKIWNTTTKELLPEVRQKIIEIVDAFEKHVHVPMDIVDIQLVGSNASYNYTEHSDLDVHIIANFELVSKDVALLQALYDAKKSSFNKSLDISIHGVPIEMYVQDINSGITSNGIYSVCDNVWVKEPKPIKSITKHNTEKEVAKWKAKIDKVLKSKDYDEISDAINMLYLIRHNGIATEGEYSKANQIFKDIRNLGLLDKLKDALNDATARKLSLENLSMGQIVNRAE